MTCILNSNWYSLFYFYQGGLSTGDWQPEYFLKYIIRFIVNMNIMLINDHISLNTGLGLYLHQLQKVKDLYLMHACIRGRHFQDFDMIYLSSLSCRIAFNSKLKAHLCSSGRKSFFNRAFIMKHIQQPYWIKGFSEKEGDCQRLCSHETSQQPAQGQGGCTLGPIWIKSIADMAQLDSVQQH